MLIHRDSFMEESFEKISIGTNFPIKLSPDERRFSYEYYVPREKITFAEISEA